MPSGPSQRPDPGTEPRHHPAKDRSATAPQNPEAPLARFHLTESLPAEWAFPSSSARDSADLLCPSPLRSKVSLIPRSSKDFRPKKKNTAGEKPRPKRRPLCVPPDLGP